LKRRRALKERRAVRGYLTAAVRNGVKNYLKHEGIAGECRGQIQSQPASPTPDQVLDGWELEHKIHALVQSLSARRRQVWLLYFQQHRSTQEIAEELGIARATVYVQLSEIRRFLSAKIGYQLEDSPSAQMQAASAALVKD
jgi:RNA polymerase sigma factor (sigma-70 family)